MSTGRGVVARLEVLEPGLLTTVQDLGRPGAARWGVPAGGAADPRALAVANALLGNEPGAAALELTLAGPVLRALAPVTVAYAGADVRAHVSETGALLPPGASVALRAGDTLVLSGPATVGLRGYLAVPGGLDVPEVLGSRATALGAGFGGLEGRALRAGDLLRGRGGPRHPAARWPAPPTPWASPMTVRVTAGPHAAPGDGPDLLALASRTWLVDAASDRMGLRLAGDPLPSRVDAGGIASHGVRPGAVQVPPDGRPIALLADAQPTGGYPVPAVVIRADLPLLGQLRPGDGLRFVPVTVPAAVLALRDEAAAFEDALAHLHEARGWDEAWHSAGG